MNDPPTPDKPKPPRRGSTDFAMPPEALTLEGYYRREEEREGKTLYERRTWIHPRTAV